MMKFKTRLEWKPEYSVGDASVDFEHEELIGQIDVLYGQLCGNVKAAKVEAVLGEIHAGISAHFALEERLMLKAGYTEYGAHKDDHEDLLDQIHDLMDNYLKDPVGGRKMLRDRLTDWFGHHFASFDARLHKKLG